MKSRLRPLASDLLCDEVRALVRGSGDLSSATAGRELRRVMGEMSAMKGKFGARSVARGVTGVAGMLALGLALGPGPAVADKDIGPGNPACDGLDKASAAWRQCAMPVAGAAAETAEAELFYAGYWLAKGGRYEDALQVLRAAREPDERVLTYIGFATRKLGRTEEAMGYYAKALARNPNYSVARAYMGEGLLAQGRLAEARAELSEIARRSGPASAEHADLAQHIDRYEREHGGRG